MFQIYRDSFRLFVATLPFLLGLGALIEVLNRVADTASAASSMVAQILLAYYIHRHFLFGEALTFRRPNQAEGAPPFRIGWFLLISIGILILVLVLSLVLLIYLANAHSFLILLLFIGPYLLVLGLFGTALPAAVARDGTYRLSQGLKVALPTMVQLVLGPGLVGLAIFLVTFAVIQGLSALGFAEDSLAQLAFYVVARTLGFFVTILAVAVLCDMYRKTRPDAHSA